VATIDSVCDHVAQGPPIERQPGFEPCATSTSELSGCAHGRNLGASAPSCSNELAKQGDRRVTRGVSSRPLHASMPGNY
jgi:hypothetical protein